jgi:uncharacterized protein YuzE
MKLTIDTQADIGYMHFSSKKIEKTLACGYINIDIDNEGNAVGLEIFRLSEFVSAFLLGLENDISNLR